MAKRGLKRPPIVIFAVMAFIATVCVYNEHSRSPFFRHDYTFKMKSEKRNYDFADCVVRSSGSDSGNPIQYIGRSTIYGGPPSKDIVLISKDRTIIININQSDVAFISARMTNRDSRMIKILEECA